MKRPPIDKSGNLFPEPPAPKRARIKRARELRDEGIKRASDHAERVSPQWKETGFAYFWAYARSHAEFTTESVRQGAEANDMPLPPDKRAWGHVARRAAVAGIVTKAGYTEATDPKVHRNPVSLWRSNVCKP